MTTKCCCCQRLFHALLSFYDVKKKRRYWIHPIIYVDVIIEPYRGDYMHLTVELRSDGELFHRYFRLTVDQFDDILEQVHDRIRLQNTRYRTGPVLHLDSSCHTIAKWISLENHSLRGYVLGDGVEHSLFGE